MNKPHAVVREDDALDARDPYFTTLIDGRLDALEQRQDEPERKDDPHRPAASPEPARAERSRFFSD